MKRTNVLAVACVLLACFAEHVAPRILDPNQNQHAVRSNHDHPHERQLQVEDRSSRFVRRCLRTTWNHEDDAIDDGYSAERNVLVDKQYVFGQNKNKMCEFLKGKHGGRH